MLKFISFQPLAPFAIFSPIQMSQWLVRQGPFSTRLQPVLSSCISSPPDSASVSSRHQTESAALLSSRQNLLESPSNILKPPTSCLDPDYLVSLRKHCQNMCSSIVCISVKEKSVASFHLAAETKIHVKIFMIHVLHFKNYQLTSSLQKCACRRAG